MAVQVSYPGVYIDEVSTGSPIEGVGTSTAAFLGKWRYQPLMVPTKITSWDGFVNTFAPATAIPPPFAPEDTDYLWYAVRGFFENGGRVCFVTAVSNAVADSLILLDKTNQNTIILTARTVGKLSPPIDVTVAEAHAVTTTPAPPNASLFSPLFDIAKPNPGDTSIQVDTAEHARQFLPGDEIQIGRQPATNANEVRTVVRVVDTQIVLSAPLQSTYTTQNKVRLAGLAPLATTFRITNTEPTRLVAGSIVTIAQTGTPPPSPMTTVVQSVRAEPIDPTLTTYRVTVRDPIDRFNPYAAANTLVTLQTEEFNLDVTQGPAYTATYANLSMSPGHPRFYATIINNDPAGRIKAAPAPANTTGIPDNRPKPATGRLALGVNHDPDQIGETHYVTALKLLEPIDDINLVAAVDSTDDGVQKAVVDHCFRMYDRFAILDSERGILPSGPVSILTQRNGVESTKGFGALYYPWLQATSWKTGQRILVPPSGYVAGIYSRVDNSRGVFKAPAGVEATVSGALGVEQLLSDTDQGELNKAGINVIRVFQSGGRPVVWGARTTSNVTEWRYVNIRRLFLFLEESIEEGIRWAVFEPNNQSLWKKLKRTITAFLTQQWRDGALYGSKPEEAFYVRIDEIINPDSERQLGRLYIEIGVRPSYPAEFIIVRIGIWQGGSEISEP